MVERCPECKEWLWSERHKCAPVFLALDEDYNGDKWEDAMKVHAFDAESAAEKASEEIDDYGCEGPHERTIKIKDSEGMITVWKVVFDYSVDYSAGEVNP